MTDELKSGFKAGTLGRVNAAGSHPLKSAIALDPRSVGAQAGLAAMAVHADASLRWIRRIEAQTGVPLADLVVLAGNEFAGLGRTAESAQLLRAAIVWSPDTFAFHAVRCELETYADVGLEALTSAARAEAIDPGREDVRLLYCRALCIAGAYEAVLATLAGSTDSGNPEIQGILGQAFTALKDAGGAARHYRRRVSLTPGDAVRGGPARLVEVMRTYNGLKTGDRILETTPRRFVVREPHYDGLYYGDDIDFVLEGAGLRAFADSAVLDRDDRYFYERIVPYSPSSVDAAGYTIFARANGRVFLVMPEITRRVGAPTVLLGPTANFGHLICDVTSKLKVLTDHGHRLGDYRFLVSECSAFAFEWFERLGIAREQIQVEPAPESIGFDRLVVPSMTHMFQFPDPAYVEWLQGRLSLGEAPTSEAGTVLLISRARAQTRRIVNEDALVDDLGDLKLARIYPETMSLEEQLAAFARCRVLVTTLGAGSMSCLMLPRGSAVVEIGLDLMATTQIHLVTTGAGQRHARIGSKIAGRSGRTSWDYDISVDPDALRAAILSVI